MLWKARLIILSLVPLQPKGECKTQYDGGALQMTKCSDQRSAVKNYERYRCRSCGRWLESPTDVKWGVRIRLWCRHCKKAFYLTVEPDRGDKAET